MAVDRCYCHQVSFGELAALQPKPESVEDLAARTGCGTSCGLCVPYLRVMLQTGQTSIPVMTPEQYQRLMATSAKG